MEENQEGQAPQEQQSSQSNPNQGVQRARQAIGKARQVTQAVQKAKLIAAGVSTGGLGFVALALSSKKVRKTIYYIIGGIVIFIFILLTGAFDPESDGNVTVTLVKTAPTAVPNNTEIPYKLDVSYTGNPTQIVVTDHIPDNTDYVSSGGPGNPTYNESTRTVTWTIPVSGGSSSSTTNNGSGTAIPNGENVPPNKDTCGGVYDNINQGGQHNGDNFGDPGCVLAKTARVSYDFQGHHWDNVPQGLIDLLKQLDPENAGYWIGIASCEAPGFDPNNWTRNPPGLDQSGAWGLFQMGSHGPYTPGDGLNGQYDRGDVNWQNQVSNAINYNKQINNNWRYWACARDIFGLWQ